MKNKKMPMKRESERVRVRESEGEREVEVRGRGKRRAMCISFDPSCAWIYSSQKQDPPQKVASAAELAP